MTKPQLCVLVWPVSNLLTWRGGMFISNTAASQQGAASFGFSIRNQSGSKSIDTHDVPQRHLPLTDATEAGAEDLVVGHKHGPDRPAALVRLLLLLSAGRNRGVKEKNHLREDIRSRGGGAGEKIISTRLLLLVLAKINPAD